jgi:hypothetical protein
MVSYNPSYFVDEITHFFVLCSGTSDPYVKFEVLGLKRKTHKIMKTLNPVYDDVLKLYVVQFINEITLYRFY